MAPRLTAPDRAVLTVAAGSPDCHQTIASALAAARDGDIVSIRPGVYPESLLVDRSVTLSGVGDAGGVRIEPVAGAAVRSRAGVARISGITVARASGDVAVDVESGALSLDECVVEAATEVAVVVRADARLAVTGSRLGNSSGAGVLVFEGGAAELAGTRLSGVATTALVVRGPSEAQLDDVRISGCDGGVLVADGARLVVTASRIDGAGGAAATVEGGGRLEMSDVGIGDGAVGVLAGSGAEVTLTDVRMDGLGAQGVVGMGGAVIALERVIVADGAAHAVQLVEDARLDADSCRFTDAGHDAVVVSGTSALRLVSSRIERADGVGVLASGEATASLVDVVVVAATAAGVLVRDDARADVEGGALRDCGAGSVWEGRASGAVSGTVVSGTERPSEIGAETDVTVTLGDDEGAGAEARGAGGAHDGAEDEGARASGGQGGRDGEELERLLAELDALVGLDGVKRQVETLVRMHQMAEKRAEAGLP
ncbi:right-handed parallel beta-helix repeat-containing protein, partial [Mycetocola reblochoni]